MPAEARVAAVRPVGEAAGGGVATEVRAGLQEAAWVPCQVCLVASVGVAAATAATARSVATGGARVVRAGEWEGPCAGSIRRTWLELGLGLALGLGLGLG